MLNLESIYETYILLCETYGKEEIDVRTLANELGVSMTGLVGYIKKNIKYFDIDYKNITKREYKITYFQGRKVKIPQDIVVSKILCIKNIYMDTADNPNNDEWLQKKIKENENVIYLKRVVFWSRKEDWHIPIDYYDRNDRYRKHLWRNTVEKINKIKSIEGVLKTRTYGWLDNTKTIHTYIDEEGIKKLKEKGWQVIKVK
jgi:hypothetical protein